MDNLNYYGGAKKTNRPYIIIYILITLFILSACSQRDDSMHLTGEDYLHKELDEERLIYKEVESRASKGKGNGHGKELKSKSEVAGAITEEVSESEDLDIALTSGSLSLPLKTGVWSSMYGPRVDPVTGAKGAFHDGIDFTVSGGTPIFAAHDGKVVTSEYCGGATCGWGNYVEIAGTLDGRKFTTLYAHMQAKSNKKVGDTVKTGEQIGLVGSTGKSTGNHLHFEVTFYDPDYSLVKAKLKPNIFVLAQVRFWYKNKATYNRLDPIDYLDEIESTAQFGSVINKR